MSRKCPFLPTVIASSKPSCDFFYSDHIATVSRVRWFGNPREHLYRQYDACALFLTKGEILQALPMACYQANYQELAIT